MKKASSTLCWFWNPETISSKTN